MPIENLYSEAFPSKRSGNLYSAFSYPTKISPEVIAVFIASHTNPGDVVLDTFAGSGTTGLATLLCSNPPEEVIDLAKKMNAPVKWGPRKAVLYEVSTLGSFVSKTMCTPIDEDLFLSEAEKLIKRVEKKIGWMYKTIDPEGNEGVIRHIIWSEILKCNNCGHEVSYWDNSVGFDPLVISSKFVCDRCGYTGKTNAIKRSVEEYYDQILNKKTVRKKRIIKRIYGQTGNKKWFRDPVDEDYQLLSKIEDVPYTSFVPVEKIEWGDLYRSGYHSGISHIHHFYTNRNLHIISNLWEMIKYAPESVRDALRFLVLSYNSSHSTLMTRVVVKSNQKDFVITGAQSGVLYISNLPVEKNILLGLKRKIKTIYKAFKTTSESRSTVNVINRSSTNMIDLNNHSVNYVFTDPPFGDYIPYSEINYLNEVWLGQVTNKEDEAIVSEAQKKNVYSYQSMMEKVFREIARVLTNKGNATVVFHSSRADIWRALQRAYQKAGLKVKLSSVLDKLQGSFKQVTSNITVQGDPLLLLEKKDTGVKEFNSINISVEEQIENIIKKMKVKNEAIKKERVFSRFINFCLENNLEVPLNASEFYQIVHRMV
ncbi:hypothetical protein GCM10011391_13620 [Pullulanibacillus camelliae]|uniref:DNA methylase N-4/N-6 domain-containing protein n=1 Tax=Pullulanibacillus camelliae TaxID=1707096 RepID=A0A8J2VUP0_9BACL|nr:DNA methyltransferase [Pullulanibacillus camelliae]GGE36083.1 hypothetical protein GCM10011391_13620 [Pullulanibacillus camelliae]